MRDKKSDLILSPYRTHSISDLGYYIYPKLTTIYPNLIYSIPDIIGALFICMYVSNTYYLEIHPQLGGDDVKLLLISNPKLACDLGFNLLLPMLRY